MGSAQKTTAKGTRTRGTKQAARAVASARGGRRDTKMIVGVVIVVVLAAAVIGGVLYQRHRSSVAAQSVIPALTVPGSPNYPASVDKATATVLVGRPGTKVTIDAYEDFLCPVCGQFEAANFPAIEQQLEAGKIQVRYHLLNLLDDRSNPPGYSMMAANTALAVATVAPGKFLDYHYSLYQKQPEENGPGWTQTQLSNLANRLGISGSTFDNLVSGKTYNNRIQTNLTTAENDPALAETDSTGGKGFGTPTIVAHGKTVTWQNPGWLDTLIKTAYPAS